MSYSETHPQVLALLETRQPVQRSQEWFDVRSNCITASNISCLLTRDSSTCDKYIELYNLQDHFVKDNKCCNPYQSKIDFYKSKVIGKPYKDSMATLWGQKYEAIASDIYSIIYKTMPLEFGLISHSTIPWLAASPDGITPEGRMIEIKCPFRRKIDGIPPFYYYIQCQIQLEVCDLEVCDFAEYEFTEFNSLEEWIDDETLEVTVLHKGLYVKIEVFDKSNNVLNSNTRYIYPPRNFINDEVQLTKWQEYQHSIYKLIDTEKLTTVYYKLTKLSIIEIKRDREFFKNIYPILETNWNKINYYKLGNNHEMLLTSSSRKKINPYNKTQVKVFDDELNQRLTDYALIE